MSGKCGDRLTALTYGHAVDLWYTHPDDIVEERILARYRAVMSPDEIERNARFVFRKGRHEHLVTRALVRSVLSSYYPLAAPGDWTFVTNQAGRPEIAGPGGCPALRFNVSHTDGLIVCLVAMDREIGIDVEDMTRDKVGSMAIAEQFFSSSEIAALRRRPDAAQPDRFFDYWTLKEAYVKARGLGLQLPLDQVSFDLETPNLPPNLPLTQKCLAGGARGRSERRGSPRVTVSFGPDVDDAPESWQFELCSLAPRHRVAVAIRRRDESDLAVRLWRVVPMVLG